MTTTTTSDRVPLDEPQRLTPAELSTLFLFESLDAAQLDWLSARGYRESRPAGAAVFTEGEEATCFFVLLSGAVSLRRRVEGTDVEITGTEQRGVYAGATQAFVPSTEAPRYLNALTAVTGAEFWVIDASVFGPQIRVWFPMAMHMLEGLSVGYRSSEAIVGQRERLLSLGRLSAGLTHELNNPAAAAVRATAALRSSRPPVTPASRCGSRWRLHRRGSEPGPAEAARPRPTRPVRPPSRTCRAAAGRSSLGPCPLLQSSRRRRRRT